ncbi:MAG: sulfite exporter TauE/SafE family protein [Pseudomonadota bacterium]
MDTLFLDHSLLSLTFAFIIALGAGLVKGMVGFGMPMIMISGLSTIMPPPLALAALILPTLVSNSMQALRQGPQAALASTYKFRVFMVTGAVVLLLSAQLVAILPLSVLLGGIGCAVVLFAALQIVGVRLSLQRQSVRSDMTVGAFAGFTGGMSGIWGPPTVMYLTALNTQKAEQVRVQGVIYGLNAVLLIVAHIASGILTWQTWQLSAALIVPAVLGTWLGGALQDRINQTVFRRATLIVLLVAGLNLIRRALVG